MVNNTGVQPLLDMICMEQMRRAWDGFDGRAHPRQPVRPEGPQDDLAATGRCCPRWTLPALLPLLVIFFLIGIALHGDSAYWCSPPSAASCGADAADT